MKTLVQKLLLFTFLIVSNAHVSSAETAPKFIYQGVDITPMVQKISEFVRPLKRPITVYHWAPKGFYPPFLTDATSNGPFLEKFVRFSSGRYWRNYGERTKLALGRGFYAAVDPSITYDFGGAKWDFPESWLLLEIQLPAGFKTLDSRADLEIPTLGPAHDELPNESVGKIAKQFDCKIPFSIASMVATTADQPRRCQKLFRHALRDVIKIDGIAYNYASALIQQCVERSDSPAFVITSESWFKPGLVKAFTKRTRIMRDDRLRILSIFANEKGEETIRKTQAMALLQYETLWSDLIGEKAVNTQDWVRKNIFGCDGNSQL